MNLEDAKIEIVKLRDELLECRAAIKDAAFFARDSPWVKSWSARYSALLPGDPDKANAPRTADDSTTSPGSASRC
jgi:hypothetical protein